LGLFGSEQGNAIADNLVVLKAREGLSFQIHRAFGDWWAACTNICICRPICG